MRLGSALVWSHADIPDLTGKRIVVTGVTSGIGHHIALELARAGAETVLAARSEVKLDATEAAIRAAVPRARLRRLVVDLGSLESVRRAAAEAAALGPIDVLVNNAGVMGAPAQATEDGHEVHFGTNYLGPFLLTGLLLPALVASGDGRVVNTGSHSHKYGRRAWAPTAPGKPAVWRPYSRSKLAVVRATLELDERLRRAGLPVRAIAADPGYVGSGLFDRPWMAWFGQRPENGARSTLMAATADLPGGTYVGPSGPGGHAGAPTVIRAAKRARDAEARRRLWEYSETATGISYP